MSGVFSTLRSNVVDHPMPDVSIFPSNSAPQEEAAADGPSDPMDCSPDLPASNLTPQESSPKYQLQAVNLPGKPMAVRLNGNDTDKPSFPLRTPLIRPDHHFSPNSRITSSLGVNGHQKSGSNTQSYFASNYLGTSNLRSAGLGRALWSLNDRHLSGPSYSERSRGTNYLIGGKSAIDKSAFHMTSLSANKSSGVTTPSRKRSVEDGGYDQAEPTTSPSIKFRRVRAGSFARSAATAAIEATTDEDDWYPGSPMDIDSPEQNNEPNMVTALAAVEAHLDLLEISPKSRQLGTTKVKPATALAISTIPSTPNSRMMPGAWPEPALSHNSAHAAHDMEDTTMASDDVMLFSLSDVAEAGSETIPVVHDAEPQPSSPWYAYWSTWQNYLQTVVSIPAGITQNVSYAARSAANAVGAAKRRVCALLHRRGGPRLHSPPGSPTRSNLRNLSPDQQERVERDRRIRSGESSPCTNKSFPDFDNIPDFPDSNRAAPAIDSPQALQHLVSQEQAPRSSISVERRARDAKNLGARDHPAMPPVRRPARISPRHFAQNSAHRSSQRSPEQDALRQQGSPGVRKPRYVTRAERAEKRERSAAFRALFVGDIAGMKRALEAQTLRDRQSSAAGRRPVRQTMTMLGSHGPNESISDESKEILASSIAVARKTILKSRKSPSITTDVDALNSADVTVNRRRSRRFAQRRVRFREPVVAEYIDDTRDWNEMEDVLAPHLGDKINETPTIETSVDTEAASETKIDTKATSETKVDTKASHGIEQKENVPPAPENDEDTEPILDPWSNPTFEFPLGRALSAVSLFYPEPRPIPEGRTESVYADRWRQIQEEERLKELPSRIKPDGPAVRPLSSKWDARIKDLENRHVPGTRPAATTLSGDPLTKRDLATCYTRGEWLNDEVINGYLALIVDYLRRKNHNAGRNDKPRFHAFNSFFFSNLRDKGYESVARWARRAKIGGPLLLDVDTVYIPVHNSQHWTLIVVRPVERSIEHFDSLGALSRRHIAVVKTWLRGELGPQFVEEEWRVLPSLSPQQDNGSDCGVFLLSTAKAVAIGLDPLSYGAQDTPLLRRKIVAELMAGGLEGEFDPAQKGHVLL
ncbi:hypothetical protein AbraIFM66951_000747 [Aspergillus brasiliensis]|uniref:Ubiquitin-like protease family profile domain-containing protein n=1 Tax=Aspergillus brasiliensis TaxID=319629 RepID=A0A9W5YWZ2_9EURO|nr:hypothetical protein AbraCBS73388_000799 [Aspergillus brasiliensis]GKZ48663.1 hypothetical protein AbraIFM66951_000747 [Aspergillus brasiliensis]